jgi:hypothetical protein
LPAATSNINAGEVVFMGPQNAIAVYASASLYNVKIRNSNTMLLNGTGTLTIKQYMEIESGSSYVCNTDATTEVYWAVMIAEDAYVHFNAGTLHFTGPEGAAIGNLNSNCYLNNLVISKAYPNSLGIYGSCPDVRGNITIHYGILWIESDSLRLAGNFTRSVSWGGFAPDTLTLICNGSIDQTISSLAVEDVNFLIQAKSGGSLIIDSSTQFLCSHYSQSGGILQVDGIMTIEDLWDDYIDGCLVVNGILDLYQGTTEFVSVTGSISVNSGVFNIYGGVSPAYFYSGAVVNLSGGTLDFRDVSVRINDGVFCSFTGGTLRLSRDLYIFHTAFNQTGGSIELYGSYPSSLILQNTPQMFSLVVNKNTSTIPVVLNGNVQVNGYLDIVCGRFQAGSDTIYSAGFFQRYPEGSFEAQTGTVEFVGDTQIVYSSFDFNNLRINCPGIVIMYNNTNVNCESFEWVSGALQSLTGNVFNAYDVAGAGIYGNYHVTGGDINLNQDSASNINIYGSVNITDGNFRIYGGSGTCNINGLFSMSGGVFDVQDQGVTIGVSCSASISGGRIRTPGSFSNNLSSLVPAGCTLEMYGDGAAELHMYYNTSFNNLIVSKEGFHVIACTPIGFTGYVYIFGGTLYSSYPVSILGDVEIYDQMHIANSNLFLGGNTYLTVHNGGTFIVEGNVSANAVVTRYPSQTGFYSFNINPGGRIAAYRTLFEYMGVNGIYLQNGAIVDESEGFHHCRFRDGAPGGTLLTLDTGQDLAIYDAEFLFSNTGVLFNVTKTVDEGNVSFYCYSGTMSGFTYEFDTLNRIFWYENEIPQVKDLNIVKETTTNQIRLDWTYPIFEAAYNIYHSDEPEGTFEHLTTVNDNFITISVPPGNVSEFFKVSATLGD